MAMTPRPCVKCGSSFDADEDWKTICRGCYKAGWRYSKAKGVYQATDTVAQVFTAPAAAAPAPATTTTPLVHPAISNSRPARVGARVSRTINGTTIEISYERDVMADENVFEAHEGIVHVVTTDLDEACVKHATGGSSQ